MDETKKLKVVIVRPQKTATIEEIDSDLETMQSIVGGYIEQVCPWEDNVALICNYDEGGNIMDIIAGTFFVVGLGEENFRSLTDEEAEKYYQKFRKPEFWMHN